LPLQKSNIIQSNSEVITPSFSYGHPTNEIQTLVNKVLSIQENAIKQ